MQLRVLIALFFATLVAAAPAEVIARYPRSDNVDSYHPSPYHARDVDIDDHHHRHYARNVDTDESGKYIRLIQYSMN